MRITMHENFSLSIVKAITEAMGGSVSFESQENVGTTFTKDFWETKMLND